MAVVLHRHFNVGVGHAREKGHVFIENRNGNADAHGQGHAVAQDGHGPHVAGVHALEVALDHERARGGNGDAALVAFGLGIVLGAGPDDVADPAAHEDARAQADGLQIGVVEKRRQLAGGGEVGVSGVGLKRPHVGIDDAAGEVHGHIVVLVAVAGI